MADRYWVGGAGTWDNASTANWSATSGGASGASAPTLADNVFFNSSSGTGVVSVASTATSANTTINSATIELSLTGSPTICINNGVLTLTAGTLTLNTFTLNTSLFNSNGSTARTINFGTGNITLTSSGQRILDLRTITNLTITGTPVFNATYSGAVGTRTIETGVLAETSAVTLNVTAGTDIVTNAASAAYKNLNFTGFAGTWNAASVQTIYGNLTVSTGLTVGASTSAITFAATSGTQQITTNGKTIDRPITQNSPGATLQLQDNLTMGSTRTFTLTAGTLDLNNLTLSTGLFNSNNANTRSIAFGTGNITLTGNATTIWTTATSTNLTVTGTPVVNATYAGATSSRTISIGNAGEANAISVNVTAGTDTVVLATTSGSYKNVDFTGFSGSLTFNNSLNIFGNFTLSTGLTFNAGTTTINFTSTSGNQQITTNGKVLGANLNFNGVGSTFAFQDALTQNSARNFTVTNGTVQLKNGVTSTVGKFVTTGASQKYLQSTLAGSQATLSEAAGTVNASYLAIKDINATGGATWNAFVDNNNVDAGNVDGWNFGISPVVGGTEYTYTLRSFTQPRRF